MEMEPYKNVLQLILFQKEFYFNYLKKRQSILMLISLAIKRKKKNPDFALDYQKTFEQKKTRKEVLDPTEDFVGTLRGGAS